MCATPTLGINEPEERGPHIVGDVFFQNSFIFGNGRFGVRLCGGVGHLYVPFCVFRQDNRNPMLTVFFYSSASNGYYISDHTIFETFLNLWIVPICITIACIVHTRNRIIWFIMDFATCISRKETLSLLLRILFLGFTKCLSLFSFYLLCTSKTIRKLHDRLFVWLIYFVYLITFKLLCDVAIFNLIKGMFR